MESTNPGTEAEKPEKQQSRLDLIKDDPKIAAKLAEVQAAWNLWHTSDRSNNNETAQQ
jgi:hypothetical protein